MADIRLRYRSTTRLVWWTAALAVLALIAAWILGVSAP